MKKDKKQCPVYPTNILTATSAANVAEIVSKAQGPVVLDFEMKGCGACESITPDLRALACERPDVTVVKVDVDKIGDLADQFKANETPALFVLAGKKIARTKELMDVDQVREALKVSP